MFYCEWNMEEALNIAEQEDIEKWIGIGQQEGVEEGMREIVRKKHDRRR